MPVGGVRHTHCFHFLAIIAAPLRCSHLLGSAARRGGCGAIIAPLYSRYNLIFRLSGNGPPNFCGPFFRRAGFAYPHGLSYLLHLNQGSCALGRSHRMAQPASDSQPISVLPVLFSYRDYSKSFGLGLPNFQTSCDVN